MGKISALKKKHQKKPQQSTSLPYNIRAMDYFTTQIRTKYGVPHVFDFVSGFPALAATAQEPGSRRTEMGQLIGI
jgi:hypothetical protein